MFNVHVPLEVTYPYPVCNVDWSGMKEVKVRHRFYVVVIQLDLVLLFFSLCFNLNKEIYHVIVILEVCNRF